MNETDIIGQFVTELDSITPSEFDVRTRGGEQNADPPEVIINWQTNRVINANGHNSFGEVLTDSNGNYTGVEHHAYFEMVVDITVRSTDEVERDTVIDTIHENYIPYETNASSFDRDTRLWRVGTVNTNQTQFVEPDWYDAGLIVRFEFMKRADETGKDHIADIPQDVENDESLDTTTTETK